MKYRLVQLVLEPLWKLYEVCLPGGDAEVKATMSKAVKSLNLTQVTSSTTAASSMFGSAMFAFAIFAVLIPSSPAVAVLEPRPKTFTVKLISDRPTHHHRWEQSRVVFASYRKICLSKLIAATLVLKENLFCEH